MEKLKILNSIINLSWLSLLLLISVLAFSFFLPEEECAVEMGAAEIALETNIENAIDPVTLEFKTGKKLFYNNCASCHNRNMIDDMTGPALSNTLEKWSEYPKEDLYNWIRNSQKMIHDNHPRAQKIWKEWKPVIMTSFPNLTDEEIESLLLYIEKSSN